MFSPLRAAVTALAVFGASMAHAKSVEIDFHTATLSTLSKTYDLGDFATMEVTASGPATGGATADAWVITNGPGTLNGGVTRGLGVVNDPTNGAAVDVERGRIAAPETVSFTTSMRTRLKSLGIAASPFADGDQMFDLYVDGVFYDSFTVTIENITTASAEMFDLGDEVFGSMYTLAPTSTGDGSGIFVNSIEIATANGPATATLLGGALVLGSVVLRRRRKAATA